MQYILYMHLLGIWCEAEAGKVGAAHDARDRGQLPLHAVGTGHRRLHIEALAAASSSLRRCRDVVLLVVDVYLLRTGGG